MRVVGEGTLGSHLVTWGGGVGGLGTGSREGGLVRFLSGVRPFLYVALFSCRLARPFKRSRRRAPF